MDEEQMLKNQTLIKKAYTGFNNREIDTVLAIMHSDIHWPKAFEGGYVIGHEAVRDYWIRQWSEINPKVEPVAITERPDGKVEVEVDQLVKDMQGSILFNGKVKHVYVIKDNLLYSMDIENV